MKLNHLIPWHQFSKPGNRRMAQVLAFFLVALMVMSLAGRFFGHDLIFPISQEEHLSVADAPLERYEMGIRQYANQAFVFLTSYGLNAGLHLPDWTQQFYYVLTILVFSGLLAVITFFRRNYFYAALGFSLLGLSFLPLGVVAMSSSYTQGALVLLALVLGLGSYFIFTYRQRWPFALRWLVFALVLGGVIIGLTSYLPLDQPIRAFNGYFVYVPLALAVLFTGVIAASIPSSILFLVTDSRNTAGRKYSLVNFLVFSLAYLGYILATYLTIQGYINWHFLLADYQLLLIISTVLAVGSFYRNQANYSSVVSYEPAGAFTFLLLGIACFGVLSFHQFEANDAAIEVIEDAVLLTHFCFGLIYVIYAIVNFLELFPTAARIHTVFYQPRYMPTNALVIAPLAGVLIFVLSGNTLQVKQAVHTYYNNIGTVYYQQKDYELANQYFQQAQFDYMVSHRNNYMLALTHLNQGKLNTANQFVNNAIFNQPIPQTYLLGYHLARINSDVTGAFDYLRSGIRRLDNRGALTTTLSHLYYLANMPDSALIFAQAVGPRDGYADLAAQNALAAAATAGKPLKDLPADRTANLIAYELISGKPVKGSLKVDSALSVTDFTLNFNQAVANARLNDSTGISQITQLLASRSNQTYSADLVYARALLNYYGGNRRQAIIDGARIGMLEEDRAKRYAFTAAHWHSQQHLYERAAALYHYAGALYSNTLSDYEMENLAWAGLIGRQLDSYPDSLKSVAAQPTPLQRTIVAAWQGAATDAAAYYRLVQLAATGQMAQAQALYASVPPVMQPAAAEFLYRQGAWQQQRVMGIEPTTPEARVYARATDSTAGMGLPAGVKLPVWRQGLLTWLKASAAAHGGKRDEATQLFLLALNQLPADESLVREAVAWCNHIDNKDLGYNLALEATEANPRSAQLQMLYIEQAERANLSLYADQGLEKLQKMVPPARFAAFVKQLRPAQAPQPAAQ